MRRKLKVGDELVVKPNGAGEHSWPDGTLFRVIEVVEGQPSRMEVIKGSKNMVGHSWVSRKDTDWFSFTTLKSRVDPALLIFA